MTKMDKAIQRLKSLANYIDIEEAHVEADTVLCEFIDTLGFHAVTEAYRKVPKWYA